MRIVGIEVLNQRDDKIHIRRNPADASQWRDLVRPAARTILEITKILEPLQTQSVLRFDAERLAIRKKYSLQL